jgi:hypothetical protein
VDLHERGALASEIRTAITELLTALDEPLPPACVPVSGHADFLRWRNLGNSCQARVVPVRQESTRQS